MAFITITGAKIHTRVRTQKMTPLIVQVLSKKTAKFWTIRAKNIKKRMFYKKKAFLLHFFAKKFCYIKKKQYLCIVKQKNRYYEVQRTRKTTQEGRLLRHRKDAERSPKVVQPENRKSLQDEPPRQRGSSNRNTKFNSKRCGAEISPCIKPPKISALWKRD